MIQPNELRIGSIVFAYPFRIIRVSEINANGVLNHGDETEEPFIFEDLEGIPLTPEILEKAGFSSGSEIYYTLDFFVITKSIDHQTWEFKIKTSWAENRTIGLRYVHQLQNLYFALTGTELEIKL